MNLNPKDKSIVALVRCESYDQSAVKNAVKSGIELLGGIGKFAQPLEKILLKPNILSGADPEKCVTTHPAVLKAVAELFLEMGTRVSYGDSPGIAKAATAARKSKLDNIASDLGLNLADFENGRKTAFSQGFQNKQFVIANGALEADGLVSLPKLKTHGLTRITGAVKNQFGCIPGLLKAEFHVKLPDAFIFSKMLVDLTLLLRPRLYIMDAIMAMEGNGPGSGTPIPMNLLLFSTDPVAMDATVCRSIDLNPEFVPTNISGLEQGLGTWLADQIETVGEPVEAFINPKFDVVRKPIQTLPRNRLFSFIKNRMVPRPEIDIRLCRRCCTCVQICPVSPKAVDWPTSDKSHPPKFQYNHCIRCYCCHETCPEKAISLKTPLTGRVFQRWNKPGYTC